MNFKKIILILFLAFFLISTCFSCSLAVSSSYIWSTPSHLLETVSDTETDLKLESDGAILIEQSTRFYFV